MAACFKTDGPLFFPSSLFPVLGEGGWGRREGPRPTAFRAPEISSFTEVAAAAMAMATMTLRLTGNGLAFSTNSFPFFDVVFSISLISGNRFPLLCYLYNFLFKFLGVQKWVHGWSFLGQGFSLYFSYQFEYLDLVQNLLVHRCDFELPTTITLRVEWVFALFD